MSACVLRHVSSSPRASAQSLASIAPGKRFSSISITRSVPAQSAVESLISSRPKREVSASGPVPLMACSNHGSALFLLLSSRRSDPTVLAVSGLFFCGSFGIARR